MIIATVIGKVKKERKEAFISHVKELVKIVRNEKGCIAYNLSIDIEDGLTVVLLENWATKQDIVNHLATEHMKKFHEVASPWFDTLEMKTFEAEEFSLSG